MQQYDLANLRAFLKVVESGSFRGAAEQLQASTAAVSRRIASLENALGSRLLNRTTRQLHLTDAGERFYGDVANILNALEEAEQRVQQGSQVITGNLRLAAPLSFGIELVGPLLPGFLKRHPSLSLHLTLEDRLTDLYAEGIDVAIRIGNLKDSSLVATRIGEVSRVCCASPDYLSQHGEPRHPAELLSHRVLHYSLISAAEEWRFSAPAESASVPLQWQFSANNGEVLKEAAIQGLGVAMLPTFIVMDALRDGRLREVLCQYNQELLGIHAVRPSRQFTPAKSRLLIEYLQQGLAA
jgi:DNA-binding transcriptional LysR family regulator